jgi:hypothetical protein
MGELRKIKGKIKPTFKSDEGGTDESADGVIHTGAILVRNYIDNLDMEFYAGRASSSGKETTEVVSIRLPSDLIKDIAIIIESGKTRFRDRSELIRTGAYIIINYIANKLKGGIKEPITLKDIEDYNRFERQKMERLKKICEDLRTLFVDIEKRGDVELDKWIKKNIDMARKEHSNFYRKRMLNAFWNVIKENGIDPEQYINPGELEGE